MTKQRIWTYQRQFFLNSSHKTFFAPSYCFQPDPPPVLFIYIILKCTFQHASTSRSGAREDIIQLLSESSYPSVRIATSGRDNRALWLASFYATAMLGNEFISPNYRTIVLYVFIFWRTLFVTEDSWLWWMGSC